MFTLMGQKYLTFMLSKSIKIRTCVCHIWQNLQNFNYTKYTRDLNGTFNVPSRLKCSSTWTSQDLPDLVVSFNCLTGFRIFFARGFSALKLVAECTKSVAQILIPHRSKYVSKLCSKAWVVGSPLVVVKITVYLVWSGKSILKIISEKVLKISNFHLFSVIYSFVITCTIKESAQLATNLYAMFCEFKLEIFGHNEIVSVLV